MKAYLLAVSAMVVASLAIAAEPAGGPQKMKVNKAEPAGAKSKASPAAPCCSISSINAATGVVTLKDLKTGQVSNVSVQNKGKLDALRVGQKVGKNL